jgi:hypothetical protein
MAKHRGVRGIDDLREIPVRGFVSPQTLLRETTLVALDSSLCLFPASHYPGIYASRISLNLT